MRKEKYILKQKDGEKIEDAGTDNQIEQLACGHQNNLNLAGNSSGKCPKGCK